MSSRRSIARRLRLGLTKVEMLAIGVVCAVALALLVPYIYQQRIRQRRTLCEQRQVEMAKAILQYEQANGRFPGYRNVQAETAAGEPAETGWVFPVLPFLGRNPKQPDSGRHRDIFEEYGPAGPAATKGLSPSRYMPELVCPANPPADREGNPNVLAWVVNSGLPDVSNETDFPPDWPANGVFLDEYRQPRLEAAISTLAYIVEHDGAEHTLLLTENIDAGHWTDGTEPQVAFVWTPQLVAGEPNPKGKLLRINERRGAGNGTLMFARPASYHRGGVNVVFCDSSNRFLNEEIDYLLCCRLMTPASQELKQPGSNEPIGQPFDSP